MLASVGDQLLGKFYPSLQLLLIIIIHISSLTLMVL